MRASVLTALALATAPTTAFAQGKAQTLDVTSTAFRSYEAIPVEYTCEGGNMSPPLAWSTVPASTKSIAILVEDPDAPKGTFTHWLVTGVSPTTTSLGKEGNLPTGAVAMKNDKGEPGYAGPCPPSGRHRYHFRVFALDLGKVKAMTRADFLMEIKGHTLASGDLVGTYEKQKR